MPQTLGSFVIVFSVASAARGGRAALPRMAAGRVNAHHQILVIPRLAPPASGTVTGVVAARGGCRAGLLSASPAGRGPQIIMIR
jgi:hypothetical protein